MEEEEVHAEIGRPNVQFISDTRPLMNIEESGLEYLYQTLKSGSGSVLINLWAGPSHWKLKGIKQASKLKLITKIVRIKLIL